jgi:hypothetical protein
VTITLKEEKIEPLSALAQYLIDDVKGRELDWSLVLDHWRVSGRAGKHTMKFRLRSVLSVDGKKYTLSETEGQTCYEDKPLTLELPKDALRLTVT